MSVDRATISVYDELAATYEANRSQRFAHRARALGTATHGLVLDAGCGAGTYLDHLGARVVGLDASAGMLERARRVGRPLVRADLGRLPFRTHAFGAAWARNSYLHVTHDDMPLALAELHRALPVGAPVVASFISGPDDCMTTDDDLPGRNFWRWSDEHLVDVFIGAGFTAVELSGDTPRFVSCVRERTLPDTVGPSMTLLVCGLNPSLHAADAGVGFVTASNRFWRAALAAGLASVPRDSSHALRSHGLGMTDLVKRATPRAADLSRDEYVEGVARVERLCTRLEPRAVCMVGLAGWRAAVDRTAAVGWQERELGGRPVYVMPSTSGLNAATPLDALVDHLRAAAHGP